MAQPVRVVEPGQKPASATKKPKGGPKTTVSQNLVADALDTVFGMAQGALHLGPHWDVSDAEINKLAKPLAGILSEMGIGDQLDKYGNWGALLIASVMIFGPRLTTEYALRTAAAPLMPAQEAGEHGSSAGSPPPNAGGTTAAGAGIAADYSRLP